MVNVSKSKGTAAETAVVRYLRANGFPHAERRALHGAVDLGDVTGTPGLVWEVKGGEAAKTASDGLVAAWLAEAEREQVSANAAHGFLIVARRQKNVRDWWAVLWADQLAHLVGGRDLDPRPIPVRITLAQLVELLADAGWTDAANLP